MEEERWTALEEKQGRGAMEKWWSRGGVRWLRREVVEAEGCGRGMEVYESRGKLDE